MSCLIYHLFQESTCDDILDVKRRVCGYDGITMVECFKYKCCWDQASPTMHCFFPSGNRGMFFIDIMHPSYLNLIINNSIY